MKQCRDEAWRRQDEATDQLLREVERWTLAHQSWGLTWQDELKAQVKATEKVRAARNGKPPPPVHDDETDGWGA